MIYFNIHLKSYCVTSHLSSIFAKVKELKDIWVPWLQVDGKGTWPLVSTLVHITCWNFRVIVLWRYKPKKCTRKWILVVSISCRFPSQWFIKKNIVWKFLTTGLHLTIWVPQIQTDFWLGKRPTNSHSILWSVNLLVLTLTINYQGRLQTI